MMRKVSLIMAGAALGAAAATVTLHTSYVSGSSALAAASDTYRDLNLFGDVFEKIRTDYVEKPDEEKLVEAAINGMLASLDPHSSYMDAKAYRDMQVQTRGEFGGLGIEVTQENGFIKVISPIDETPAARAGVKPGDFITHLNGNSVQGLTLQEAVEQMRGERGSVIRLTIRREGTERPIELSLTRDVIRPQVVRFRMEGTDIGYVRLTSFNEQTDVGLRRAVQSIRQQAGNNLRGIILDLRNNPGGLLDQAVQVSDDFLEQGEIVSTRARRAEDAQRWNARAGDIAQGLQVVVLVNGGSASASEIVAGALQDHRRAIILGTKSFGKGSVQTVMPIPGNGAIRLTTARYYTPSGRSIQGTGIEPDIEVLASREDQTTAARNTREREADLRRALRNEGGVPQSEGSAVPPLNLPSTVTERVQRMPAEGAPAFDPTKPETDFQLQQAAQLLRNLVAVPPGQRRAAR